MTHHKAMLTGSYNAELIKQLSPEMQAKMQNYVTQYARKN